MKSAISREGIYFLFIVIVVLVGAIIREINPMLLFAAFLCSPLIIAWRLGRRSLRGLKVRRRMPIQIFAGEPFIVHLETSNPRPKNNGLFGRFSVSSWGVVIVDRIQSQRNGSTEKTKEEKPYEPAVYFEYVPNEQTRRKTYAGRLPQRGRYAIGPLMISTRFPFGFFRHWFDQPISEGEPSGFVVYPKLGKLSAQWKTRQHETIESRHRHRFRPSRVSGEFLGVRRWQQGDSRKWIHWRASARHQTPVVRQFEQHQNRDYAILIDLYQGNEMDDLRRENFELAVSFTATLVSETMRHGGSCFYFDTSEIGDAPVFGSVCMPMIENVLYRLALVEPNREDALAGNLLKAVSVIDSSAELILVTTESLDPGTSKRFENVWKDPRFRALTQRLRIIDTSNHDLDKIFSF